MALSPFPADSTERTQAIAQLKEAAGSRGDDDAMAALGEAAAAMVERFAPGAPQPVKDEAVIRLVGFWAQSDFGGVESETSVGNQATSYFRPPPSAFRYSGAMGMLTHWKVRRAGVIA